MYRVGKKAQGRGGGGGVGVSVCVWGGVIDRSLEQSIKMLQGLSQLGERG